MTTNLTPIRDGDRVIAVGRLIVRQGHPGLLLAHDRLMPEQVRSLDGAAAVPLTVLPDPAAIGDLIRVIGQWDGRSVSVAEVTPVKQPPRRPSVSGVTTMPDAPKPFSGAGSQVLRDLNQAGILSGRRIDYHAVRDTVLVSVTDPYRAQRIVDLHKPAEHFSIRQSRWTSEHLLGARSLALSVPEDNLFSAGESYDEQAEAHVTLCVKLIRDGLAARTAGLPSGLVTIDSFLQPVTLEPA